MRRLLPSSLRKNAIDGRSLPLRQCGLGRDSFFFLLADGDKDDVRQALRSRSKTSSKTSFICQRLSMYVCSIVGDAESSRRI